MIERVALTTAGVRDRWLRPRLAPASDRPAAAARLASGTWALPLLLTLAVAAGSGVVAGCLHPCRPSFARLAVAALLRVGTAAARSARGSPARSASAALPARAQVGTALIRMPIGISVAVLFLAQQRRLGWRRIASFAW